MLRRSVQLLVLLVGASLLATGQDISGTITVHCIISDAVAEPTPENHTSLIKTQTNDPCAQGKQEVRLGGHINLLVEHGPELKSGEAGQPRLTDLLLVLNGTALPGTNAEPLRSDSDTDNVTWTAVRYNLS